MNKYIWVLVVGVLTSFTSSVMAEVLLFERTLNVDRSVNIFSSDEFDLDITLGDQFFNPSNPVTLFDDLSITPSDAGSAFEILVGDPALEAAQQRLTDAKDEFIRLILAETKPGGRVEQRGSSESGFFLGLADLPGPDLAGATVERIRLEIDQFTLAGGSAPSVGSGPPVDLQVKVSIFGQIPEPSTVWLLGSGLATLWTTLRRGWRRQRVPVPVRAWSHK